MPNEDLIRDITTRACRDALQEKLQEIAESVASRMGAALGSQLEAPPQLAEELRLRNAELQARDEELRELTRQQRMLEDGLRERTEELSAQERQAADLAAQLQARDEELGERIQELRALEEEAKALRAHNEELGERTSEANSLGDELRARTGELHAREQEAADLAAQLQFRDEELHARTKELQELEEEAKALRARCSELGERRSDARLRDEELRARTEKIEAREHALGELSEQLRARDEDLRLRNEESTAREDKLRESNEELQERIKELARVRGELRDGTLLIAGSRSQTETLETLLAAASAITPECGLLIMRGSQASGWNCNGLTDLDNFKRATMDCSRGVAATVVDSQNAAVTKVSELDPVFVARLGLEGSAEVLLVPVLLKERVAALLLALPRRAGAIAGLELLAQVAQLALDLHSYRKAAPHGVVEQPRLASIPHRPEPDLANSSPARSEPALATVPPPNVEATQTAAVSMTVAPPTPIARTQFTTPVSNQGMAAPRPVADQAHEKARRFAKLLVEEIKLYNQNKVAEGRARRDLYSRLRDDIEKSRAAYDKRYGESVKDVDYFTQELVRILADNDRAAMGAGFPS
jgi:hypothetical protein